MAKKKSTKYDEGVGSYAADHSDLPSDDEDDDSSTHPQEDDESTASSSDAEARGGDEENSSDEDGDEVDSDEDDDEENGEKQDGGKVKVAVDPAITSGEGCTFDMKNLIAINSHQVSSASLYKKTKSKNEEESLTIPPDSLGVSINEDLLMEKANEGCTQLLSALWQLPMEKSDTGPVVTLPGYFEIATPRSLPPPPPKKDTKWERFAKERGIPTNKEKRSRKVWDETTQSWGFRHGYQKANNDAQEWPIMEVKRNDDPLADPWEKIRDAKKKRVDKNTENRMRNQERAGVLAKGTATRTMKNIAKNREAGKKGGNLDKVVPPSGVPVDLKQTKTSGNLKPAQRGRESTAAALLATQKSTASLGKFDKMREGEPERKKALAGLKKRKYESATDRKVTNTEAERGMKLLNSVMTGGGVAREKAKRSGKLAKGETAYDYDYDDGLGASTFRKKKGRAGSGKQKKITKKRIK
mmetsp:Transcript_15258/g.21259  ORF Transcript_15258/g.21259 Transcript_15258/m.21259 type:complete len:469 (+) Transcript_15258:94-1500(+)